MAKSGIPEFMFGRYGASIKVQPTKKTLELGNFRSSVGYTRVKTEIDFPSEETYIEFARDMSILENLREEEALRSSNPTLQNAWEEYQLLLKLSK